MFKINFPYKQREKCFLTKIRDAKYRRHGRHFLSKIFVSEVYFCLNIRYTCHTMWVFSV